MTLIEGMGSHQSARPITEEWLTPPHIINALGGPESFDLDPCAPIVRPWPTARRHMTVDDNGLAHAWHGRVWLNPPYTSHVIGKWLGRLADHGCGVALIFARTETQNFFRFVWRAASAVLFIEGRLHFCHPDGRAAKRNAGAPSVLCAYGKDDADVLALCDIDGQFVPLRIPRVVAVAAINVTWTEALTEFFEGRDGPVDLAEMYRTFANHPKTKRNPNYRAKLRQVLQRGPFARVGRGLWQREAT